MRMKRTNLVLDEQLLETATKLLGARTYSAAVNRSLEEAIRAVRRRELSELFGSGIWDGDLAEMRGDKSRVRTRRPPVRKRK